MPKQESINYIEYPAVDLVATKAFFSACFGWCFTDYGPDYTAFSDAGLEGGFYQSDLTSTSSSGAALLVLVSEDLESSLAKVVANGGRIGKDIFSFPGGRRFQFFEPSGNELAVWSLS